MSGCRTEIILRLNGWVLMSRFQIFLYRLLIYTANHFSSTLPLQYWAIQPWKMSGKWKAKMKMKLLKRLYIPYAVFKAPPFCLPEMLGKCKMFFVPTTKGMGCFPASLLCMLIAGPTAEAATSCWTVSGAACFITSSWLKISLKDWARFGFDSTLGESLC